MAGKMEPEEAFRLIDPRGVKQRALTPGETVEKDDAEDKLDGSPTEPPKWLRYTIISITVIVSLCFVGLLGSGIYLLYDKKEPEVRELKLEDPIIIFSETEVEQHIEATLKAFLACNSTEDRLLYVATPELEREPMIDYYDNRKQLDASLWKIRLIKAANLEGGQIWMVAYYDVKKRLRYSRFERSKNRFVIQWSSSYGYGDLSWSEFMSTEPTGPVAMRAFVLRHMNVLPAGIDPKKFFGFVVENKRGEVTSFAIMEKSADGAHLLSRIPPKTRTPVYLRLGYIDLSNGTRQLVIHELIHFQWRHHTMSSKGRPVRLK
jgi:hypothetical protein|tara:strand:- start:1421 stop:2377 length:957 start_codon:yes stop_codon:yes gene_type:complete